MLRSLRLDRRLGRWNGRSRAAPGMGIHLSAAQPPSRCFTDSGKPGSPYAGAAAAAIIADDTTRPYRHAAFLNFRGRPQCSAASQATRSPEFGATTSLSSPSGRPAAASTGCSGRRTIPHAERRRRRVQPAAVLATAVLGTLHRNSRAGHRKFPSVCGRAGVPRGRPGPRP